jgi:hypothetical protein
MKIIEDQIQSCINSVGENSVASMVIPNYWLTHDFTKPENVQLSGHDGESMVAYDADGNCLTIMMSARII